ncbi:GntR family transcriptional regulator [Actinomadura sp. 3N508]|uniref:GntR family transcriptional regulator n=1 Tax=Actinomadura sp. 3N508 TaxID=3375153 RepID=UPI0037B2A219
MTDLRHTNPGDGMPEVTERELMELTGVSRTSIREAVLHLQTLGLVETSGREGVRVAVLGSDEVRQLYEVRAALESEAAALFVRSATDFEVLELVKLTRPGKFDDDQLSSIYHFGDLLLAGARNALLESTLAPLHARIHALRRLSLSIPGPREVRVGVSRPRSGDHRPRRRPRCPARQTARGSGKGGGAGSRREAGRRRSLGQRHDQLTRRPYGAPRRLGGSGVDEGGANVQPQPRSVSPTTRAG